MSDDDRSKDTGRSESRPRIQIERVLDSHAQGLLSIRDEQYFHGFMPAIKTQDLLVNVGDFLVRQGVAVKKSTKDNIIVSVRIAKSDAPKLNLDELSKEEKEAVEEQEKNRLAAEIVHQRLKYSRRSRVHYMHKFGFRLASGLIGYHQRREIPIDEQGTLLGEPVNKGAWQLNHEQITKSKKLGDGAYGDVFKGELHTGIMSSTTVAFKTINSKISDEENEKLYIEAMLMKQLKHPNIIQLIGVASNENPLMVVMEFAEQGSVLDLVKNDPRPSPYHRVYYCYGAAKGLAYLESKKYIHRDIAARNVLVGKDGEAKISDFGLSLAGVSEKRINNKKDKQSLPVFQSAPEICTQNKVYSHKSDVFAYGVYVWEVFHDGAVPWNEFTDNGAIKRFIVRGGRLKNTSPNFPASLWQMVTESCWPQRPEDRANFAELRDFIAGVVEEFKPFGYEKPIWSYFTFWK